MKAMTPKQKGLAKQMGLSKYATPAVKTRAVSPAIKTKKMLTSRKMK